MILFQFIIDPDKHSMSDVLSPNDARILGLVLPQGHLDRLKLIGLNIEDKSPGELTKEKVADALKDIGQGHLAKILSDREGKTKLNHGYGIKQELRPFLTPTIPLHHGKSIL